jgi:hypothetical protein
MEKCSFPYKKASGGVPSQTATMFTAAEKATNTLSEHKASSVAHGKTGGKPL